MSFLDNYEDVATRIQRFWATYPNGRIETNILDFNAEKGYVLIQCRVWRDIDDLNPAGTDIAFGNVSAYNIQMKRFFCEDTSTSAIGRAVGLVLGTDKRPTAQNMAHVETIDPAIVESSADDVDLWAGINTTTTPIGQSMPAIAQAITGNATDPTPRCTHGARVWKTGEKNGKAWAYYKCQEANRDNQCAPIWYVVGADGKWKPQV